MKIYNSLSNQKETLKPINPSEVKMYVCGMTVYDHCHLGHARVLVVFDMVYRWLQALGYQVIYVRNITDVDDKIIRRAVEKKTTIHGLTDFYISAMHEDAQALNILKPTHEPRATKHIPHMIQLIQTLIDRGLAYVASNQDVFFSVRQFDGYGRLSGKTLDELRSGERVAVSDVKKDPLDFVLWKHRAEIDPDEATWRAPWGDGRPGWHIECSAMSCEYLGQHFDIHGGGQDLQFPHHENEIAQSEGANESTFVNIWMHNGFIRVDEEKMSKSLGNFQTIRDVLKHFDGEVVRFFILRAHYRSPLNYSTAHLKDADIALSKLYSSLRKMTVLPDQSVPSIDWERPFPRAFLQAMNDDFNTPRAIAVLFEMSSHLNIHFDEILASELVALGSVLGLLQQDPVAFFQKTNSESSLTEEQILQTIEERIAAKKNKNFKMADAIREKLFSEGIILEDTPTGTQWRRETH